MSVVSVSIPKYCRHNASGRAYVKIHGKRHYLGRYGTPESKERYARFVSELAVNPVVTPTPSARPVAITVVELAAAYQDFAEEYYRKNGVLTLTATNIRRSLLIATELYGRTPAKDFGPLCLLAIQRQLAEKKLARRYVNDVVDKIRRCFKWGTSRELIPGSVYHALSAVEGLRKGRTTAREPDPVLPVDEAVVNATLPHLPPIVADMVRFQRLTGCRPGEVCQLRPMDLDRSAEVWQYRPASHKTEHHGKERIIFVGPKAQAIILPYLLRDTAAHCFSPAESEEKRHVEMRERRKSKLTPSQRNRRKAHPMRRAKDSYTKDSYARAIRRGVDKANKAIKTDAELFAIENPTLLAHWAPNRLRHTRATEVRKQFGLEAAQVVLGHSKANVTEVYAERDSALAVEVMKKIG
jgi:integrase